MSARHGDETEIWNRRFEAAWRQSLRDQQHILFHDQGTVGQRVAHASQRLGLPAIRLELPPVNKSQNASAWDWLLDRLVQASTGQDLATDWPEGQLWISPCVESTAEHASATGKGCADVPLQDRVLVLLPDQVRAITIRAGGRTQLLITQRAACPQYPRESVKISPELPDRKSGATRDNPLTDDTLTDDTLTDNNARHWLTKWMPKRQNTLAPIVPWPVWKPRQMSNPWTWLTHCTRGRQGCWPDQSIDQFRDGLLLGDWHDQARPFETLLRILDQGKLIGTSFLKRSPMPTVSLSAAPLPDLLGRRSYRKHLGRWDWEPYGLCIKKSAIQRAGGRAVVYGSDRMYGELEEADQPYFQARGHSSWIEEKEWRVVGDLRLAEIPREQCVVFVPTLHEARILARITAFPVLMVEESKYSSRSNPDAPTGTNRQTEYSS
jgi:hypothetical protein